MKRSPSNVELEKQKFLKEMAEQEEEQHSIENFSDDYINRMNPIGFLETPSSVIDRDILEAYYHSRNISGRFSSLLEGEIIESGSEEGSGSDTSTESAIIVNESEEKLSTTNKEDKSPDDKSTDKSKDDSSAPSPSRGWYKWLFLAGAIVAGITMGFLIGPSISHSNLSIVDNSKALFKIIGKYSFNRRYDSK